MPPGILASLSILANALVVLVFSRLTLSPGGAGIIVEISCM